MSRSTGFRGAPLRRLGLLTIDQKKMPRTILIVAAFFVLTVSGCAQPAATPEGTSPELSATLERAAWGSAAAG